MSAMALTFCAPPVRSDGLEPNSAQDPNACIRYLAGGDLPSAGTVVQFRYLGFQDAEDGKQDSIKNGRTRDWGTS